MASTLGLSSVIAARAGMAGSREVACRILAQGPPRDVPRRRPRRPACGSGVLGSPHFQTPSRSAGRAFCFGLSPTPRNHDMKEDLRIPAAAGTTLGHVRHGHGPIHVLVLHDWLGDHSSYDALMPCLDGDAFS